MNRTIELQKWKKWAQEAYSNPITTFSCDYAAAGAASLTEHARRLLKPIQQACFYMRSPIILAGRDAYTFLQVSESVGGFLLYSEHFHYISGLSSRARPINFIKEDATCSSCGHNGFPVAGLCEKCKSPHQVRGAEIEIPVYATTQQLQLESKDLPSFVAADPSRMWDSSLLVVDTSTQDPAGRCLIELMYWS